MNLLCKKGLIKGEKNIETICWVSTEYEYILINMEDYHGYIKIKNYKDNCR